MFSVIPPFYLIQQKPILFYLCHFLIFIDRIVLFSGIAQLTLWVEYLPHINKVRKSYEVRAIPYVHPKMSYCGEHRILTLFRLKNFPRS